MRFWWDWARLHARKLAFAVLLTVVAFALAQTLPADLALWFGGEMLTYLDVVIGVALVASIARVRPLVSLASAHVRRFVFGLRRMTARRRRATRRLPPPSSDSDRPAPAFA